jgi:uncharacterized membrane protein YdbT with pleckstrin-like domain
MRRERVSRKVLKVVVIQIILTVTILYCTYTNTKMWRQNKTDFRSEERLFWAYLLFQKRVRSTMQKDRSAGWR